MSANASKRLYDLLPAIYRVRDAEQQLPLQAFLEVFQEYRDALDENLDQLHDDAFIETCAEWAALYIGDLIGYRPLHGVTAKVGSPRAEVANTIRYRRRKGTASMLEQLARDVTGWNARAVEFFEWLAWNQYMQHTRVQPPRGGTADLRDHDACERVTYGSGAFNSFAHSVDVRRISNGVGRYNVPNVGLFLWRINPYTVHSVDARKVADGHYTFNVIGADAPLFNPPQTEDEISHLAEEINVPGPLRRRILYDELENRRRALAREETPRELYFGASPVFQVWLNEDTKPVPPEKIVICNLEDWHAPAASRDYLRRNGTTMTAEILVAVDPVLGRLTFSSAVAVRKVSVSYTYGFSDAMGGGPYNRTESLSKVVDRPVDWQVVVGRDVAPIAGVAFQTIKEAVAAWNSVPAGKFGVIAVADSHTYSETLVGADAILIPGGSRLLIIAATWPERAGQFVPSEVRSHVLGNVSAKGIAGAAHANPGELILNGVIIEGNLTVLPGSLGSLNLTHCTVVPQSGHLVVQVSALEEEKNLGLTVRLDHSIAGPVSLSETVAKFSADDSLVSNGKENDFATIALDAPATEVAIQRTTVFGAIKAGAFHGSDSIFTGDVHATRRQAGCVRFSYLPPSSRAPRRYRCQPDLETALQVDAIERKTGAPLGQAQLDQIAAQVQAWLLPSFTAARYGQPGLAQLRLSAPAQIRRGASDEAEMGAFHDLYQPQRETNLRVRLEEYLRCNLEAGIFYVT